MRKVPVIFAAVVLIAVAALLTAVTVSAQAPKAYNQCKACHKVEAGKNAVGPSHFGVVGRTAGTAAGYKYSRAMEGSGITWDEATLTKYIADPKSTVPGNKMPFPGLKKAEDVTQVVEYLKTLK